MRLRAVLEEFKGEIELMSFEEAPYEDVLAAAVKDGYMLTFNYITIRDSTFDSIVNSKLLITGMKSQADYFNLLHCSFRIAVTKAHYDTSSKNLLLTVLFEMPHTQDVRVARGRVTRMTRAGAREEHKKIIVTAERLKCSNRAKFVDDYQVTPDMLDLLKVLPR